MIKKWMQCILMASVVTGEILMGKGSNCTLSQCTSNLECLSNICNCDPKLPVWNGTYCQSGYETSCSTSSSCRTDQKLTCVSGSCGCSSTAYWDVTLPSCKTRKVYGGSCSSEIECLSSQICPDGVCTCEVNNYYSQGSCHPKLTKNKDCNTDEQCLSNLECVAGKCNCNTTEYWNQQACLPQKIYGAACLSGIECLSNQICPDGVCTCKFNSYYSQESCHPKVTKNKDCNTDEQCVSNLKCLDGKCNCNTTEYWNQQACLPRGSNGSVCMSVFIGECQDNMICKDGRCHCTGLWDADKNICITEPGDVAENDDDSKVAYILAGVFTVIGLVLIILLIFFLCRRYGLNVKITRALSRKENSGIQHYENAEVYRSNQETTSGTENLYYPNDHSNQDDGTRIIPAPKIYSRTRQKENERDDNYDSLSPKPEEDQYLALDYTNKGIPVTTESAYANVSTSIAYQQAPLGRKSSEDFQPYDTPKSLARHDNTGIYVNSQSHYYEMS